jgi:hypothetical protein
MQKQEILKKLPQLIKYRILILNIVILKNSLQLLDSGMTMITHLTMQGEIFHLKKNPRKNSSSLSTNP